MSRFEVKGNTVDKNSEKVLVNNVPAPDGNDGDVKFRTEEEFGPNSAAHGRCRTWLKEGLWPRIVRTPGR